METDKSKTKIFFFISTKDKISEVEEVLEMREFLRNSHLLGDKEFDVSEKHVPFSTWEIPNVGDTWLESTFISRDKAILDLERDKEIERIEKKYHTVEDGTIVERSEFSEFSNRFNVVLKTSYSLTKEDWKTLCTIMESSCENGTEKGWWQFRSGRQEEFDRSGTLRWEVCDKLFDIGFLHDNEMDWNLTYYVTDLGKQVYEQSKNK